MCFRDFSLYFPLRIWIIIWQELLEAMWHRYKERKTTNVSMNKDTPVLEQNPTVNIPIFALQLKLL